MSKKIIVVTATLLAICFLAAAQGRKPASPESKEAADKEKTEKPVAVEMASGLFSVGHQEKDWDFVPELVGMLKEAGLSFKVALVISVYEAQDAAIVESIKSRIADRIGETNLLFLQDLSQDEMADYYYLPDVFVMSSLFESFGKAAVEAMSRKCAVLSTSVGGLTEVIGREEDLYTKEDTDRFVQRIIALKDSPEILDDEREYFYQRYRDNY